jgi:Ni,Fe-hydrogenase III large subunit
MKKLLFSITLACALALGGQSAFAQAKKKTTEPAAPPAEKAKGDKPIPMYVRADEIDAAAKTITQVSKDGKKSKNSVTATTEIKNGDKDAKFGDIKVGDMVSGNRHKTGDGTYDIVKITKFGPKAEKPAGDKKPEAPAKPKAK